VIERRLDGQRSWTSFPQPHARSILFLGPPDRGYRWQLEVLELLADPVWRGNHMNPNFYRHLARLVSGLSARGREVG